jgi:mycothiol synthase
MWALVDQPAAPEAFFARVLPRIREAYEGQYRRALGALEQGTFEREVSVWATEGDEPVGVALVAGGAAPELSIVAVREAWRRRGVGRKLVAEAGERLRRGGAGALIAPVVSSANTAAVRLLESAGFVGVPMGGLRMRRPLDAPWPAWSIASGYLLRTLKEGEETVYARLKSACFPESRPWTEEDFRQEFPTDSFDAYGRIFVVAPKVSAREGEGQLVGTASAWEIDHGDGAVGLVHWVGVDPAHRGQGLGAALNLRVLEELAARGYPEAWLNTSRDRVAAVRLYEQLGFALHRELYTYTLTL